MVEAMTEQEFITGVADGTLLNVDVIKYCVEAKRLGANLNDILDEMFAQSLSYHTHQIAFVEGTDEIKDYGGVSMADQAKINRLFDAMGLIQAHFGIDWGNSNEQQETAAKQPLAFSGNVDTDKAIWWLIERLKQDGWITPTESGYKWQRGATNQLIAYWVECVSLNFNLSNKYINEKPSIKWKPFEALFGLKDGTLKTAKQSWLKVNTKFTPTRFEEIEPYTKAE